MTEPTLTDDVTEPETAVSRDPVEEEQLFDEELLVEEISIDGMCGVY